MIGILIGIVLNIVLLVRDSLSLFKEVNSDVNCIDEFVKFFLF